MPSWPSSHRTTYGGAPSAPRTSRISPSRRGEPTVLLSTTRWSPILACILLTPSVCWLAATYDRPAGPPGQGLSGPGAELPRQVAQGVRDAAEEWTQRVVQ